MRFTYHAFKAKHVLGAALAFATAGLSTSAFAAAPTPGQFNGTPRYAPGTPEAAAICKKDRENRRHDKDHVFSRLEYYTQCGAISVARRNQLAPEIPAIEAEIVASPKGAPISKNSQLIAAQDKTWRYPVIGEDSSITQLSQTNVWLPPINGNLTISKEIDDETGEPYLYTNANCNDFRSKSFVAAICEDEDIATQRTGGEFDRTPKTENRCRVADLISYEEKPKAVTRNSWAHQCGFITSDEHENCYYEIKPTGRVVRNPMLFASFAKQPVGVDPTNWQWPLWRPENDPVATGEPLVNMKPNENGNFDDCRKPADVDVYTFCPLGCYAPDQKISFESGAVAIETAVREQKLDIITLSPEATFDDMQFMTNEVDMYTADPTDQIQPLVTIETEGGGKLRVTPGHPIVSEDGTIRYAQDFQVGDRLVRADGTYDAVKTVYSEQYFGKVYNVRPVTMDDTSNILVAEGFLNASSRHQSEDVKYLKRSAMRRHLASSNLPD